MIQTVSTVMQLLTGPYFSVGAASRHLTLPEIRPNLSGSHTFSLTATAMPAGMLFTKRNENSLSLSLV